MRRTDLSDLAICALRAVAVLCLWFAGGLFSVCVVAAFSVGLFAGLSLVLHLVAYLTS